LIKQTEADKSNHYAKIKHLILLKKRIISNYKKAFRVLKKNNDTLVKKAQVQSDKVRQALLRLVNNSLFGNLDKMKSGFVS